MNVDISLAEPVATRVWFEFKLSLLFVDIDGIVTSIDFQLIPESDFESSTPVTKFTLGYEGTVVICHHRDGAETWLPVDMWLPKALHHRSTKISSRITRHHEGQHLHYPCLRRGNGEQDQL